MTSADTDGEGSFAIDETFRTSAAAPTDIRRYIASIDPAGPDQPQYRSEPVIVSFANNDVDGLFAAYGQQVVTRLKADVGGDSANMGVTEGRFTVATASDSFEQAFVDGVDGMSCVDGEAFFLFPKTEVRSSHERPPIPGTRCRWFRGRSPSPARWTHTPGTASSRWRSRAGKSSTADSSRPAGGGPLPSMSVPTEQRCRGMCWPMTRGVATTALTALPALSRGDAQVDALLAGIVGGPISCPPPARCTGCGVWPYPRRTAPACPRTPCWGSCSTAPNPCCACDRTGPRPWA